MKDVIRFAKKIPGFSELNAEDRITLVHSGCFEVGYGRMKRKVILDPYLDRITSKTVTRVFTSPKRKRLYC